MNVSLKYTGSLNPVVKGVGIIKNGQVFECDALVASRLLEKFPKEYCEAPKKKRKPRTVKGPEVEMKMTEPKEFKAEPIA